MKICCVTGNRPQKFPWKYGEGERYKNYLAEMVRQIEELIESGYSYFVSGGALGIDQDFAEAILRAKQVHAGISLEIAVPCRTQADRWNETEKLKYRNLLKHADNVVILSERYTKFCMQNRNKYMVDKANLVLAYWNGAENGGTWNTIKYERQTQKNIIIRRI